MIKFSDVCEEKLIARDFFLDTMRNSVLVSAFINERWSKGYISRMAQIKIGLNALNPYDIYDIDMTDFMRKKTNVFFFRYKHFPIKISFDFEFVPYLNSHIRELVDDKINDFRATKLSQHSDRVLRAFEDHNRFSVDYIISRCENQIGQLIETHELTPVEDRKADILIECLYRLVHAHFFLLDVYWSSKMPYSKNFHEISKFTDDLNLINKSRNNTLFRRINRLWKYILSEIEALSDMSFSRTVNYSGFNRDWYHIPPLRKLHEDLSECDFIHPLVPVMHEKMRLRPADDIFETVEKLDDPSFLFDLQVQYCQEIRDTVELNESFIKQATYHDSKIFRFEHGEPFSKWVRFNRGRLIYELKLKLKSLMKKMSLFNVCEDSIKQFLKLKPKIRDSYLEDLGDFESYFTQTYNASLLYEDFNLKDGICDHKIQRLALMCFYRDVFLEKNHYDRMFNESIYRPYFSFIVCEGTPQKIIDLYIHDDDFINHEIRLLSLVIDLTKAVSSVRVIRDFFFSIRQAFNQGDKYKIVKTTRYSTTDLRSIYGKFLRRMTDANIDKANKKEFFKEFKEILDNEHDSF